MSRPLPLPGPIPEQPPDAYRALFEHNPMPMWVYVRPDMRILYVSGYSEEAIARQGQLTKGIELLSKPFTPGVLTAKIRELLDRTT